MVTPAVQTLIAAVRRRLWAGELIAAARMAAWSAAALMLLAVAAHLAVHQIPPGLVALAAAAPWAALAIRALARRPADADCALWVDRHLGGASAFTTLLELAPHTPSDAPAAAVRWLQAWAVARVPEAQQRLAAERDPPHLARPLLAMGVCAALAAFIVTLPGLTAPAPSSVAALAPARAGDRLAPAAEAPAARELASELASALRSAATPAAPERTGAGGAPAAGPAGADDGPPVAAGTTAPAADRAADGRVSAAAAADATPPPGAAARATGKGAGREAGDSRDERADVGVSRLPQGTIAVQRFEPKARRPASERQADLDQRATYDDGPATMGAAAQQDLPAALAATPPAAARNTRLTPTETSYVQAWMKASGQHR